MSRRILTLACAGLLLAVGTGCPTQECTQSTDCKDGKQCIDNKCQAPASACDPACSGATPVCDEAAKKCKVCTASKGCTGGKLCDTSVTNGKCVTCLGSQNCGLELPVCDPATKTCVTCTEDEGCEIGQTCDTSVPGGECVTAGCSGDVDCGPTPATPVCDTANHQCVVCTATKGCTAPATCDTTVQGGQCKGCTSSAQCTTGNANVCDTGSGKCVVCTATEGCTAPQVCDTTVQGGQCKQQGCNSSVDCNSTPSTPVCDTATHACVVCTATEGCANGKKCDTAVQGGQCKDATCTADADCAGTAATPVCDTGSGKCVVCTATKGCTAPATCDTSVQGGQCKGCTSSAQCNTGTANVCDTGSGKCVVCTATEGCSATQHCDTSVTDGKCVDNGCTDNGGCTGTPATPTCDTTTGKCVVCTATSGCASPLVCDTSATNGKCVDCLQSSDCTGDKKVCDQKKCVTCTATAGCASPLVCDTAATDGQCVECTADGHCTGGKVCDTAAKKCVTCTAAKGCTGTTPVCDTTVTGGQCVGCTSSTQCAAADATKPVCDATTKTCVVCTATEGCTGKVCQDKTACVECLASTDCKVPATPVCDTAQNKCVTCTATEGCSGAQTCQNGQCVGCNSSTDCSGGTPVCDTTSHICVVCTAGEGCTSPKTCDTSVTGGACVGCASHTECAAPTPACDDTTHRCVTCTADNTGCSGATPKCKTGATPACVECLQASDCTDPAKPVCGPSNTCIAAPADVSQQIADAKAATPAAALSMPIDGAYVTYLKPATGNEKAGFFLQGAQAGPAIFVELDPALQIPSGATTGLAAGDKISFKITEIKKWGVFNYIASLTDLTRASQGNDLTPLVQDVSTATDIVSALASYDFEYIKVVGKLTGSGAAAGTGYTAFPMSTAGVTATPYPTLRVPTALKDNLNLDMNCTINLTTGVMWRYNNDAEPSCYRDTEIAVTACDLVKVLTATATSPTTVVLTFNRTLNAAEVAAADFTFTNSLNATAAAAAGSSVTVTTDAQTANADYTVTVAGFTAIGGAAIDTAANTASFKGWQAPAGCVPNVVISQIYGGAGASGLYQNDYVELHNRSATAVDVTTWSVQYGSATGTSWASKVDLCSGTCTARSIPAGGYLLVALASGTGGTALPTPDVTSTSINLSGSNGKVALVASKTSMAAGACPTAPVDAVGYGTVNCASLTTTPVLSATSVAVRNGGAASPGNGCTHTGSNSADFTVVADPTTTLARNSASTAVTCGCD